MYSTLPHLASSKDYVQATGRGGRDGAICFCILFFRDQDCAQVKRVLKVRMLSEEDRERIELSVENVCKVRVHEDILSTETSH
jgi:superfamily II DNA helicase RecQ